MVGSLFGWVNRDGVRRFRIAYIETAKGSGKSPMSAGIGIYGLVADGESRAEVYIAATKRDQAMVMFRDAVSMVDQSPALSSKIKKRGRLDQVWSLVYPKTSSFFMPISSEDGQSGPRPSVGLIDEVHEHKDAKVINMMQAGFKFRVQPMIVMITNSGSDKLSPCGERHDYAIKIATGQKHDDEFFGYVCALDDGDDPFQDENAGTRSIQVLGMVYQRFGTCEVNSTARKACRVRRQLSVDSISASGLALSTRGYRMKYGTGHVQIMTGGIWLAGKHTLGLI